jgi:hypothetical protein
MAMHELKIWPGPYQAVADGSKTFEIRKNDRGFKVCDWLWLREWDPHTGEYTGCETVAVVSYMVKGGNWGVPDDMCVMSIIVRESVFRSPSGRRSVKVPGCF